jgi:4,5-DOPA dioxygenase extradiol
MNRKTFLQSLALLPFTTNAMKLRELNRLFEGMGTVNKTPVLFLGHGSPMNAIAENEFVTGFRNVAKSFPKPNAILCISAHWETRGTYVTAMQHPRTIHDFAGFPQELFNVQYPASGSPVMAAEIQTQITMTDVVLDDQWGLDHGAWSVLVHLYPNAEIPVIQMSIDYSQGPQYHYELAKQLRSLRQKGVLIVGSGNMVHNLGMVDWKRLNETFGFDWALEASDKMKNCILNGNHKGLIEYRSQGKAFEWSIPTPEHYLPLLYVLAVQEQFEDVHLFNDKAVAGALTMTSVKIG